MESSASMVGQGACNGVVRILQSSICNTSHLFHGIAIIFRTTTTTAPRLCYQHVSGVSDSSACGAHGSGASGSDSCNGGGGDIHDGGGHDACDGGHGACGGDRGSSTCRVGRFPTKQYIYIAICKLHL